MVIYRPRSCIVSLYLAIGAALSNEMKICINYAPGVGSIARLVDLQSNALPLYYHCPLIMNNKTQQNPDIEAAFVDTGEGVKGVANVLGNWD